MNNYAFTKGDENAAGGGTVAAPMHGNLLKIFVSAGDEVKQGQPLVVMEAMKMEHQLKAQIDGKVHAIHAVVGNQVAAGSVLIEITELAN